MHEPSSYSNAKQCVVYAYSVELNLMTYRLASGFVQCLDGILRLMFGLGQWWKIGTRFGAVDELHMQVEHSRTRITNEGDWKEDR